MRPHRTLPILRAVPLALAVSLAGFAAPPLRVGVGRIYPISYFDDRGVAAGFAVEVVNEAARREQIALDWVRISKSPEEDLRSGAIDLLPANIGTAERKRVFYVSEPWWSEELSLLAREGAGRRPKRLGIQQVYVEFARPYFDPSAFVLDPNPRSGSADVEAKAVCRGTLDGALITHGELHDLFLNRPAECNGVLLQSVDTAITYGLSIISRTSDSGYAKRIRNRIDDLVLDGTLLSRAAAHPPIPTSGAVRMAADIRERAQNRLLKVMACVSLLFAALLGLFLRNRQRNLALQRRLQQELQSAWERLTLKHEIARLGSYEWFSGHQWVEWSAEMEGIFGVHAEDYRHRVEEWESLVHADDRNSVVAAVAQARAERRSTADLTYRIVRADRKTVWIHSRSRYSYDADGKLIHDTGVVMDISDAKQGEIAQQILGGLLEVCSACRRVHNDDDEWYSMEGYLRLHRGTRVSHGMCPDCSKQWFSERQR